MICPILKWKIEIEIFELRCWTIPFNAIVPSSSVSINLKRASSNKSHSHPLSTEAFRSCSKVTLPLHFLSISSNERRNPDFLPSDFLSVRFDVIFVLLKNNDLQIKSRRYRKSTAIGILKNKIKTICVVNAKDILLAKYEIRIPSFLLTF